MGLNNNGKLAIHNIKERYSIRYIELIAFLFEYEKKIKLRSLEDKNNLELKGEVKCLEKIFNKIKLIEERHDGEEEVDLND